MTLRVAFAGTPEFAAAALARIQSHGFDVPLVLTQPDRPSGRGMKLQASPVKQLAQLQGLALAQPHGLRLDGRHAADAAAAKQALADARPDVLVVAAYGLILPAWLLALPRLGGLNIHASLLPRWRGAAPIQRAIEAGDTHTGVTIMQMDEGLDTGPMLMAESLPIAGDDTAAALLPRLAAMGARLIVEALEAAACGGLHAVPQPLEGITYAHKIGKDEALVDWRAPADGIERRIRAFDPFPGVCFEHAGETVKVWQATVGAHAEAPPGTVIGIEDEPGHGDGNGHANASPNANANDGTGLRVACGHGTLTLTVVQRPGGRRQPVAAFVRAAGVQAGQRLGGRSG
jgi:methionyl-tRNA formyltransferase